MRDTDLIEAVRAAATTIRTGTGAPAWNYFEHRIESAAFPSEVHHAVGLIDGAAIALNLTALELLSELGIDEDE